MKSLNYRPTEYNGWVKVALGRVRLVTGWVTVQAM